jgi:chromosome partitioning protein
MAKHAKLDIALPSGGMSPIGYVAIKFSIMKQKPTKAFQHWIDAMPAEYRTSISEGGSAPYPDVENDEFCLAKSKITNL